jgi:hypothetical protein
VSVRIFETMPRNYNLYDDAVTYFCNFYTQKCTMRHDNNITMTLRSDEGGSFIYADSLPN